MKDVVEGELAGAKRLVRAHHDALRGASPDDVAGRLSATLAPDLHWRGMHPFYEQDGTTALAQVFWAPVLGALTSLQRREDVLFAGRNDCDGGESVWVASMGHLMGLFDAPLLGIPPTRRMAFLRYAEFSRVEGGLIVEQAMFCDLISLMRQAGVDPLPPQTGADVIQPGPMTQDGLLTAEQDPAEGERTMALINGMVGDIDASATFATPQEELRRSWHEDMIWWGPAGIGSTYTIDRYVAQHQGPFRRGIGRRVFNGHVARIAEGTYGGFFGWANLTVTNAGGYLGLPAHGPADMRVVDIYRRDGDRLAENWVFIDLLHWMSQMGVDALARMRERLSGGL
ncbi:MAG: nuclear transport factor 2 family protein [Paracoccaceae bacterium]